MSNLLVHTLISLLIVGSSFVHSSIDSSSTFSPIARSQSGLIRGVTVQKTSSIAVNQFLGIPYAQPPTGSRRFARPQPLSVDPLRIIDATKPAATCIQFPHLAEAINPLLNFDADHKVSEDCLYLNIYAPISNGTSSSSSGLPVMVWFAGEGYDFADANQFDGSYLSAFGQVIVITVQYRVGVFGFLKDDIIAQGNMGLWDQVEALKWVHENVAAFGGDSKKVTVFGRFTGSMSITHLLASPILRNIDKPLFTRAILMSGVAGDYTMEHSPNVRAKSLLRSLGCDQLNASKCLYFADSDELLSKSGYGWKPTVDGVLVTDEPLNALARGEIAKGVESVMIGSTAAEGSICLLTWMFAKRNIYNKLVSGDISDQQVIALAKKDLKTYQTKNGDAIFQNFLKSRERMSAGDSLVREYINFCSDLMINSFADELTTTLSTSGIETSTYRLHYKPAFSMAPDFIQTGAHGDDVLLAFGLAFDNPMADERDLTVSSSLLSLISSFAWSIDMSSVNSPSTLNGDLVVSRATTTSKLTLTNPMCNDTATPSSCSLKKTLSTLINTIDSKPSVKTSIPNYSS